MCEQKAMNKTPTICQTTDWSDIRTCAARLSEKELTSLGILMGYTTPLCSFAFCRLYSVV